MKLRDSWMNWILNFRTKKKLEMLRPRDLIRRQEITSTTIWSLSSWIKRVKSKHLLMNSTTGRREEIKPLSMMMIANSMN